MSGGGPGEGPGASAPEEPDRDDVDPGDGRRETAAERDDRNWNELLQELRAVQTGTQILSGFLLAVAFQPRFAELDLYARTLYLVLVVAAGVATVLGLAPVVLHRSLFRKHRKHSLVHTANRLLVSQLVVVAFIAAGVPSLIFEVVLGRTAGLIALGVGVLVLLVAWLLIVRAGRTRDGRAPAS
ncbi:DUF6328 family protein [Agromyces soli]